jgi:hypothetical protein
MDGAFSFNCGDPLFIISKAPPGAKSDKKLMKIPVCWKTGIVTMFLTADERGLSRRSDLPRQSETTTGA